MEKLFIKDTLKNFIKYKTPIIDNSVFRLHYQATTLILIAFSILVGSTQFFGKPIQCIQRDDIPENVLNSYCWVESTFTLPKALTKIVGEEVVYPGVEKQVPGDHIIEHAYYQWVALMLLLQASMFYACRVVWKLYECGRIKQLLQDLNLPVMVEEDRRRKCTNLAKYFHRNSYMNNWYANRYSFCEVLNLLNVVGQIFFVDLFLGGEFTTYGIQVIRFTELDQEERCDPMIRVFPRMTKCTFHKFGSSGDVQRHDALCLLPLNIINEKIYVFLWFWFVILSAVSSASLIYRVVLVRWQYPRLMILRAINRLVPTEYLEIIIKKLSYGDWFVLYMLGQNMEDIYFKDLLCELAQRIDTLSDNENGSETAV